MSYLCKMETLLAPTGTSPAGNGELKLLNPSNYNTVQNFDSSATPAVDKTSSILFETNENMQNYLKANCVKTDSLVPEGNGGAGIMSFVLLILLIASVVYLMMPKKTGNNSFGLAKSSFTF